MKSHQRIIRENSLPDIGLFPLPQNPSLKNAELRRISYLTAKPIIVTYEWIGAMPLPKSCRFIYGVYFEGQIGGAIVYVQPSQQQFNAAFPKQVVQLNRGACLPWTPKNTASWMISKSFHHLRSNGIVAVVAYCTPEAGEFGTIYQACNFHYVGQTSPDKTYFLDGRWCASRMLSVRKKWAKHRGENWVKKFQNLPSKSVLPKFRYVKTIGTHKENKEFMLTYNFVPKPYPKRAVEVSKVKRDSSTVEGEVQFLDAAPTL